MKNRSMKLKATAATLALMLSLVACGESTPAGGSTSTPSSAASSVAKPLTTEEYRTLYGEYSDQISVYATDLSASTAAVVDAESAKAVIADIAEIIAYVDTYADVVAPAEYEEIDTMAKSGMAKFSEAFTVLSDEMVLPMVDVFENGAESATLEELTAVNERYVALITEAMTSLMGAQTLMDS